MATRRVRRILVAAEPRGDIGRLTQLLELTQTADADAIALLGDLTPDGDTRVYREIFKALGTARVQTFWVPGPRDAPLAAYLRESYNLEAVFPFLHGVHGTIALSPDYVLFAGMGGRWRTTNTAAGSASGGDAARSASASTPPAEAGRPRCRGQA